MIFDAKKLSILIKFWDILKRVVSGVGRSMSEMWCFPERAWKKLFLIFVKKFIDWIIVKLKFIESPSSWKSISLGLSKQATSTFFSLRVNWKSKVNLSSVSFNIVLRFFLKKFISPDFWSIFWKNCLNVSNEFLKSWVLRIYNSGSAYAILSNIL